MHPKQAHVRKLRQAIYPPKEPGPGDGPDAFPSTYARSVNDPTIRWDTLDIYDSDQLTYSNSNEYAFPIAAESADTIIAAQVIEHVKKIWVWLREVERVCKPGATSS
jgi:hypothetical protein